MPVMLPSPRLALPAVILASACAAVLGCASPAPLVRLEPRSGKHVVWVAGRAVLAKEQDGVRAAAAFEQQDGNLLALRVEVENQTDGSLEVTPERITFVTCKAVGNDSCGGAYQVVDPEDVIAHLDERQSREAANAKNEAAFNTSLVLLSAVGDVASLASPRHRRRGSDTLVAIEHAEASAARAEATQGSLASRRQVWSDVALRRTTLASGRGTSGLVYVPVTLDAAYVWIFVQAGGHEFPFGFKQQVRHLSARSKHASDDVRNR
jgi:hypothetical protein